MSNIACCFPIILINAIMMMMMIFKSHIGYRNKLMTKDVLMNTLMRVNTLVPLCKLDAIFKFQKQRHHKVILNNTH